MAQTIHRGARNENPTTRKDDVIQTRTSFKGRCLAWAKTL